MSSTNPFAHLLHLGAVINSEVILTLEAERMETVGRDIFGLKTQLLDTNNTLYFSPYITKSLGME
jgi:hypothetical protein